MNLPLAKSNAAESIASSRLLNRPYTLAKAQSGTLFRLSTYSMVGYSIAGPIVPVLFRKFLDRRKSPVSSPVWQCPRALFSVVRRREKP
jgi:hypothetical protein